MDLSKPSEQEVAQLQFAMKRFKREQEAFVSKLIQRTAVARGAKPLKSC